MARISLKMWLLNHSSEADVSPLMIEPRTIDLLDESVSWSSQLIKSFDQLAFASLVISFSQ
ncbi:hypothetical protein BY996DRAFT_6619382 [Phakopsora pachyrhizi]|nr:hypothetical protein BY996DRAFT_6619382 [Phakopsora pachyrhizi]